MAKAKVQKPTEVTTTDLTTDKKIVSIEEALDASNLNFICDSSELMGATANGLMAPDHKMLYREDTGSVLGIVGKKYQPIQNSLAMSFMDAIVKKNEFSYTQAVSKNDGAVTIMVAESDRKDEVKVGDDVARQIRLVNGFNGKTGFSVEFTMLRLVCTNGMVKDERESIIRFKHTINVQNRMEVALRVFDEAVEFHSIFLEQSRVLAQKAVDANMVDKFLEGLFKDKQKNYKKCEEIHHLFEGGKGNHGETAWDLYNGVTEWVDHHADKGLRREDYALFGSGHKLKAKAWDVARAI